MTESVHEALETAESAIDSVCNRINDATQKLARMLLAYRVEMSWADHDIVTALAGSKQFDRYLIAKNAISTIEGLVHDLEAKLTRDLGVALSHIQGAADFARERAALDTHYLTDPVVRKQVFDLTGGKCAYCATDLKDSGGEADQFCIEHVVPASKGGPNHITNYVPSCRSCNNSKGDRHVLYFIQNSFVMRQRMTP